VRIEGATYFSTVVTYNRLPILTSETSRKLLHQTWQETQDQYPFETITDPIDFENPIDYIHYNPIKHGYV
jgi:REP element-mobilizing transposase RayT